MTRPGVPTTTWVPLLNSRICSPYPVPPYTATTRRLGRFSANPSIASATCRASSRVGASTRIWAPLTDGSIRESKGREKAAVLPVPVWATPRKSLPASRGSMASSCMGEGVSYPALRTAFKIGSAKFISSKLRRDSVASWSVSSAFIGQFRSFFMIGPINRTSAHSLLIHPVATRETLFH